MVEIIHSVSLTEENFYQELEPVDVASYFRSQILELIHNQEEKPEKVLFLCRAYQMAINALLKDLEFESEDVRGLAKVCYAEEEKFRRIMTSTVEKIRNNRQSL